MKIAHFYHSLSLSEGGPAHSVSQLGDYLARTGQDIVMVEDKSEHGGRKIQVSDNIRCSSWNQFVRDVDSRVQIMHSHGIWLPFNHKTVGYSRKRRIPLIISPRGMLEPWALEYHAWKKKIAWHLYQKKDLQQAVAFHATALSELENMRRLGVRQPIAVIPNGVEPVTGSRFPLEHRSGEKRRALFLSRIHPKKGLPLLLKAWAKLKPADWELWIAGNDEDGHQKEVETLVVSLGIQDRVHFAGALYGAEKEAAYHEADLFVLPSYSENFGIVVAEALSRGVPVITTTGTPWKELETEYCGWWVKPEQESFIIALREATEVFPRQLQAMGENGRRLVERKYHWPVIAREMIRFYQWILGEGEKPQCVV